MERFARPAPGHVRLVAGVLLLLHAPFAWAAPGLTTVQEIFVGARNFSTTFVADVDGSPDGINVYALDVEREQVRIFRRDAATGQLAAVGSEPVPGPVGGYSYGQLALSPDGTNVYVAKLGLDSVSVFARDPASGLLSYVGEVSVSAGSFDIAVSPDGAHAYVAGSGETSVFARDGSTGQLTLVEVESGSGRLRLSPDGAHLYAAAGVDGLGVWSRNPVSGELSPVQTYLGVPGITNPVEIVIAPGGQHVYVANDSPGASIALHDRNGVTGELSFVSEVTPGASELAISSDGARVYAYRDDLVEAFARDELTGALTSVGGTGLVSNNSFLRGLMPAPDSSRFVYGGGSDTIFAARELHVECPPAPVAGCLQPTTPGMGLLKTSRNDRDALNVKTKLKWRWLAGSAFGTVEIGDLAGENDYALCLYDASADPQPLLRFVMRAGGCLSGPCWKQLPDGSFKYRDKGGLPDGVKNAVLRPGAAGASAIQLAAKGFGFPFGIGPPWTLPVVAQLHTAEGVCWEATYSSAVRNETVAPEGVLSLFQAVPD